MTSMLTIPRHPAGESLPVCGDVFVGQMRTLVGDVDGRPDGIYQCAPGAIDWSAVGSLAVEEGGVEEDGITRFDFDGSDFDVTVTTTQAAIALAYGTAAGTPAEGNHTHPPAVPTIIERAGSATSIAPGVAVAATASCVGTEVSIGGGLTANDRQVMVNQSRRSGTTGWTITANNEDSATDSFTPYVMCMDTAPTITERAGSATSIGPGVSVAATATCNAGEVSIAGGLSATDRQVMVNQSRRSGTTAWTITANSEDSGTNSFTPYVVCMAAS